MTLSSSEVSPVVRPVLLVSVRSAEEAVAAVEGGAGIIDVKEPLRGPLGMASVETIFTVASAVKGMAGLPVSAALGEVLDWRAEPIPVLPPHLRYAKVGLAGLAHEPHWPALWRAVRDEFDVLRGKPLEWVAVGYADHLEAASPELEAVLEAGIEAGCKVFLVDTWNKTGERLIDLLSIAELTQLSLRARQAGVAIALAGRVQAEDIRHLLVCRPEIIAVRGAACASGQRESIIDRGRVAALVNALSKSTSHQPSAVSDLAAHSGSPLPPGPVEKAPWHGRPARDSLGNRMGETPMPLTSTVCPGEGLGLRESGETTSARIKIQINGQDETVPADSTVAQLLVSLGKNPKFLAVERNRELVPRTKHAECLLSAGDQIEIVTLVGGG